MGDSLLRLASAATPGPWIVAPQTLSVSCPRPDPSPTQALADAAYIAAASPDVVLALLAVAEAARDHSHNIPDPRCGICAALARLDALRVLRHE